MGGTQSLHTNAFDEALGLPTDFSARIARNTQLVLQEETGIPHVVDPLGGSYYVEALTAELADKARALMAEVEELGGMTKAVESGMPKLRIEESAARRQARIDRGEEVVVGVNKYVVEHPDQVDVLDIDNRAVLAQQIAKLERVRATRDEEACQKALTAIREGAAADGNLLALCVDAARARATVGEMSDAMESVFDRHRAQVRTLEGVYGHSYEGDEGFAAIQADIEAFADEEGRRPRMLVVKMGQDGHDRGRQGDRHRVRRPRLRRRRGPAVPDPGRGRPRRGRERRPRRRRVVAGRRAQDPRAPADRGAARGRAPATCSSCAAG